MAAKISVKYIGHLAAIEVDLDGLGEQTLVRNQTVEISADIATSLLEQTSNWQLVLPDAVPAPAPAPVAAKATPTKAEEAK